MAKKKFDCMEHHINGHCLYCLLNDKVILAARVAELERKASYSLCYDEGDYPFNHIDLTLADYGHSDHAFVLTSDELDAKLKAGKQAQAQVTRLTEALEWIAAYETGATFSLIDIDHLTDSAKAAITPEGKTTCPGCDLCKGFKPDTCKEATNGD